MEIFLKKLKKNHVYPEKNLNINKTLFIQFDLK